MDSGSKRLQELLDGILDGSSTDEQLREFAELIDRDRQLSAELVERLRLHSLLQWKCGAGASAGIGKVLAARAAGGSVLQAGGANSPAKNDASESHRTRIFPFSSLGWRWAAAAVFVALAGVGTWYGLYRGAGAGRGILNAPQTARNLTGGSPADSALASATGSAAPVGGAASAVAEVFDNRSVVWSPSNTALLDSGTVVTGRLEMSSGTLTLKFRSGATMTATGDVSMRIVSDMLVLLDRGKATAHVPQWAKGFTIKTKDVEVVDLGTQFGVMARDGGATDVVVFEGKVDYKPTSGPSSSSETLLSQGQGVRVNEAGAVDRIVEVRRDVAKVQWTADEAEFDQLEWSDSPFKSIRDNIPSVEVPTYYQITPKGLRDDCKAYVDAPHEWNGLTSEGLPEFLQDADYVMTRNDYRYINEFEMTVELARPSMVYVFWDRRVAVPEWLTSQFENTGVDIGLDEGPWKPGDTKHALGVGGGVSIDTIFSVWQRKCERPETLKFGSMGKRPGPRAMYGIAAKPLE